MSHVTSLLVGLLFNASVFANALLAPGSAILNGHLFFDSFNGVTLPSVRVDSGSVVAWPTQGDITGGGIRITASGSDNFAANYLVPASTGSQSGFTLLHATVECGNQPLLTTGSIVANQLVTKASITTGTALRHQIKISSGSYTMANSGAVIGTKLTAGTYLSFITNASGGAAIFSATNLNDCVFRPVLHAKYGR